MKATPIDIAHFTVAGISHKKAPLGVRARFHISEERMDAMKSAADACGLRNLFALATCNRTELYGFTQDPATLGEMLIAYSDATPEDFRNYGFVLSGHDALRYLFRVGVGLESQILGDLQIYSQVKSAFQDFRTSGLADGQFQRLMQHVARANKRVKSQTNLSKGAASIAYAAGRHIYEFSHQPHRLRILVVGAGNISRVLTQNLVKSGFEHVRIVNRTQARAEQLAAKVPGLVLGDYQDLDQEIAQADAVIVATGAKQAVLDMSAYTQMPRDKHQLVIDLAVPRNVDAELDHHPQLQVIHMDHLNDAKDEALAMRRQSIPEAEAIVEAEMQACEEWMETRRVAPAIQALKQRLEYIRQQEIEQYCDNLPQAQREKIDRITSTIVRQIANYPIHHLKQHTDQSEALSELLMDMFQAGVDSSTSHQ